MAKISSQTHISPDFAAEQWPELRKKLIQSLEGAWNNDWETCLNVLSERVKTRFINPIDIIIRNDSKKGEGFTVVSILCILLEFFSALHQGKIYKKADENYSLLPFEYTSSGSLFKDFLTTQRPFKEVFTNSLAGNFFSDVRCGLLHEARTKQAWRIKEKHPDKIYESIGQDHILYRTNFFNTLKGWFQDYKIQVRSDNTLKNNLLRKMDDILDISRCLYFAYGSNMNLNQLKNDRKVSVFSIYTGVLENYFLFFNKLSKDGTGKANIVERVGCQVYGIIYEVTKSDLTDILDNVEKGYQRKQMQVKLLETDNLVDCHVYIAENPTQSPIKPSTDVSGNYKCRKSVNKNARF